MEHRDELQALMRLGPGHDIETAHDRFLSYLTQRPAWMTEAACRSMDRSIFFPERGQDLRPAKDVCATCAVSGDCAAYAIETGATAGIWGGVTATNLAKRTGRPAA
jgi:WhiB family redox-sensing transcriptional regulator